MSLLKGWVRIALFVACSTALATGCGGLRRLPLTADDAGQTGGIGGGAAGIGGRGGAAGTVGTGGSVGGGSGTVGTGGANNDGGNTDAPTCVAGGACVPPTNACHKGQYVCMEGVRSCMELTDLQANGTVCDVDKVCHNGSCDSCVAGMACDVTGKPCRVGSIVCATGAPVCTETDNKPNGTGCGNGMVCQNGACATCQANTPCQPTNKCHNGSQVCSPSISCMDANTNVAAGTACGTDQVCDGRGACASCMAGADCAVPGKPCSKGTTTCNTGAPVCVESGNQPNGTVCGAGNVCQNGTCMPCAAGAACQPANPCHGGITVCSPSIGCTDTGNALTNGLGCGTDKVCNAGTCVSCAAGASCQPTTVCRTGVTTCATGSPVCSETGNQPNGTSCGTNMVCNNGTCATCAAGSCVPSGNPCHTGTLSCSTGAPVCTDSGANQPDGTTCGMNLVCKVGNCVSCTAGQACQPTNPCRTGATSCATGSSVCGETGNKGAGTQCGAAQSCTGGVVTTQGMCNATGMCTAATMTCTNGCNTAGTDCANCPPGQTSCPAGCRDLTGDPMNCGGCANACPAPAPGSGIPVCVSSTCDISCNPGYLACDPPSLAICQQTVWDFEDQSLEGFKVLNNPTAISGKPVPTNKTANTGKFSLGVPIDASSQTSRGWQIGPTLCAGRGPVIGKGLIVSAWLLIEPVTTPPPPPIARASYVGVRVYTESAPDGVIVKFPLRGYNTWFQVSTQVPAGDVKLTQLAVEGVFVNDVGVPVLTDWIGAVYIDDVTIQVP